MANICSSKAKEPGSNSTPCAKRRKYCLHESDQPLPSSTVVAVKEEAGLDGSDNDENDDPSEFVDTRYCFTSIRVDDTDTIDRCIHERLNQIQQTGCKIVAKPWIKAREPRKQTKYPYNGGDKKEESIAAFGKDNPGELTKPPWWPDTAGWPTKGCRHKEPDHLKKSGMQAPRFISRLS